VRVRVRVAGGVRMRVHVAARVFVKVHAAAGVAQAERVFGDVFGAAVDDAAGADHAVRHLFQLVRAAAHDDDFEAVLVIQMDVHAGPHLLTQIMLQRGEAFGQLADVVVVDQRDGCEGRHSFVERGAAHLGARQITQELRTVAAAADRERIQLLDQARLHRDAKTDQVVFHASENSNTRSCAFSQRSSFTVCSARELVGI
jgi:hypothetical protein